MSNVVLGLKILSLVIILGGMNYCFGILGLVVLGYSKQFMRAVLIAGVFNILSVTILALLLKDIGVSISLVLSESLLLILLHNWLINLGKVKKLCLIMQKTIFISIENI